MPIRVIYEDWQRDTSRVDAVQIRLRLFAGTEYFQFVTIPIPAPELRRYVGSDPSVTIGQLWWFVAKSIQPQLEDAIRRGEIPKRPERTTAYEVEVNDLESAVRMAREAPADSEAVSGEAIYQFEVLPLVPPLNQLRMQVDQIVNYGVVDEFEPTGERTYRIRTNQRLTEAQENQLQSLAQSLRIALNVHDGHRQFSAGPI
jgi:hypothetical protein